MYSNTGTWVTSYRCGTAVISTMPTTFNGSIRSVLNMPSSKNPTRGSIDLDDYSGGFGTWSGTSFSAPALAGDIAAQMLAASAPTDDEDCDRDEETDNDEDARSGEDPRVTRASKAIAAALEGAP